MLGQFKAPEAWFSRVEATFIEPDRVMAKDPRMLAKSTPTPGARLSIRRGPAETEHAAESLTEFANYLIEQVPGIRKSAEGPVTFKDGTQGAAATFLLDNEGMTWAQRHVYRHDAGWVTHFTMSVTADAQARLEGELWGLINTWQPSAG